MFVLQECDRVVLRKEGAAAKVFEKSFSAAKKKSRGFRRGGFCQKY